MATVFDDTFNTYADGDLQGQGGWTSDYGTSGAIDVQSVVAYESKAANGTAGADEEVYKAGTARAEGLCLFYLRQTSGASGRDGYVMFFEGSSIRSMLGFRGNDIQYRNGAGFSDVITDASDDTWYVVQAQWTMIGADAGMFRFRGCLATADITAQAWSAYATGYSAISASIDTIKIYTDGRSANQFYFDYFDEDPYVEVTGSSWRDVYQIYASTKSGKGGVGGSMPSCPCNLI